jgi:hypothetical protein
MFIKIGCVCIHKKNTHTYTSIYVCTVFLKKYHAFVTISRAASMHIQIHQCPRPPGTLIFLSNSAAPNQLRHCLQLTPPHSNQFLVGSRLKKCTHLRVRGSGLGKQDSRRIRRAVTLDHFIAPPPPPPENRWRNLAAASIPK